MTVYGTTARLVRVKPWGFLKGSIRFKKKSLFSKAGLKCLAWCVVSCRVYNSGSLHLISM